MRSPEFKNITPRSNERVEKAEKAMELWAGAFNALWKDLQEVEAVEGKLDGDDPRLTSIKIAAMRLDEAKMHLKNPGDDTRTQIEA
jgi:hypothetical protein